MKSFFLIVFTILLNFSYLNASKKTVVKFGFADDVVLPKFEEYKEHIKLWVEKTARGDDFVSEVNFYYSENSVISNYISGKIDGTTFDFISFNKNYEKLSPITYVYWTANNIGQIGTKYCLIGKKKNKFDSLKDITNKDIIFLYKDNLSKVWLDKVSFEENKKSFKKIVKNISYLKKESSIILSLFFNKADFAVVTDFTWNTMLELNPKIKDRLIVNECSKVNFISMISILSNITNKKVIKKVATMLKNYNKSEAFSELLDTFGLNEIYFLPKKKIIEMNLFYKEYLRLKKLYD